MWKIFLYQVYTNLAYVPPTYRRVKKLQVLIINKNLCTPLDIVNGNEILIWIWNNPPNKQCHIYLINSPQTQIPNLDSILANWNFAYTVLYHTYHNYTLEVVNEVILLGSHNFINTRKSNGAIRTLSNIINNVISSAEEA